MDEKKLQERLFFAVIDSIIMHGSNSPEKYEIGDDTLMREAFAELHPDPSSFLRDLGDESETRYQGRRLFDELTIFKTMFMYLFLKLSER